MYEIFHDSCGQWHVVPEIGSVVCEFTGESFEIAQPCNSSWPGEVRDAV